MPLKKTKISTCYLCANGINCGLQCPGSLFIKQVLPRSPAHNVIHYRVTNGQEKEELFYKGKS